MSQSSYDVIVVGGGHNGLTAATYLAKAGLSVLLLERSGHTGGASVSAETFPGTGARLSRYSYLVSLMPRQIVDDLGLGLTLARRRYASYTPSPEADAGLLIDHLDQTATEESFARIGASADVAGWRRFGERTATLAEAIWPTMMTPLPTRSRIRELVGDDATYEDFLTRPLGDVIEASVSDDLVRGMLMTDGLISTYARAHQEDLSQNICFLYHVIGGGTGDWDVPVGGMGAVSDALERAARDAGVTITCDAVVEGVTPEGEVTSRTGKRKMTTVHASHVLWAAAPAGLDTVMGVAPREAEGAQVKVNILLDHLPRLRDPQVSPQAAFGGTFHAHEGLEHLETSYAEAAADRLPDPLPVEVYCHSLTDPSILSPELHAAGAHTLTAFSLQTPHRLTRSRNPDQLRADLEQAVLDSLSSVLDEPMSEAILRDQDGRMCLETKTTLDLEDALAMPGGNIFHGPLSWPFAEDDEELADPASRWGVASGHDGILLAGAGSRRGGGVSGLGGYHAAQAVLEMRRS